MTTPPSDPAADAPPAGCNIDARGRLFRGVMGVGLCAAAGALLAFWALPIGGTLAWAAVGVALLGGLFGLYEAKAGWCAARAMGIKTRF